MQPRGSILGKIALVFVGIVALFFMGGCYTVVTYISVSNQIIAKNEKVNETWALVQNQYKNRADLIPGLVEIVKGAAAHESQVLREVTEARAKATSTNIDVSKLANDPEAQKKFLEAQQHLGAAMSRFITSINERYPQLGALPQFATLQKQYEGTNNRITVARTDNQAAVREYNMYIQQGVFAPYIARSKGFSTKPYYEAPVADQEVPKIDFSKK
jgi:LemA protein